MSGRYIYEIVGGLLIVLSSLVSEEMSARLKKWSYLVFGVFAAGYIAFGITLNQEGVNQQATMAQEIKNLTSSVDLAEQARKSERDDAEKMRRSDRDAFLAQLNALNRTLSDMRASVQTGNLRKQLDETQRSLFQTQRALEKQEVKLRFLLNGQASPATTELRPDRNGDRILAVGLSNDSEEDTGPGMVEISISCADCPGLRIVGKDASPSWNENTVGVRGDFSSVPKRSHLPLGRLQVVSTSKFPRQAQLALRYRCLLCVPEEWQLVTVNFAQP